MNAPLSDVLSTLALSVADYEQIVARLGREPNALELGLFGALWSEHCGYRHTKKLIMTLPNRSERTLTQLGGGNAGVVDIGGGLAVAMKIESHNHPSAIEPVNGAATGVGGIIRDILAMGAFPIAILNSLRFGMPDSGKQRFLLSGVVEGISRYGNCVGIPNVGGELYFDDCYRGNPLVNAMCVGLVRHEDVVSTSTCSAGDLVVLAGAKTGKDGIHGASGLASQTLTGDEDDKTVVQVGDPYAEKVLIESCLRALRLPGVVGMQDCGAAGITSAAIEMADSSGLGLTIDVAEVHCRTDGMTPYEIMLSESQERMILAVRPGHFDEVRCVFDDWDVTARVIGRFDAEQTVTIKESGAAVSVTPIKALTAPPLHDIPRSSFKPELQAVPTVDDSASPADVFARLLSSPNVASRLPVYRQYDHQVQNNSVILPGSDAALLQVPGTEKGLALSVDGNSRFCKIDPYVGTLIAVAEACRNVSVVGAEPVAITDGLNLGDPTTAEVRHQLVSVIDGLRDAANAFDIPIISGNASLYNEENRNAINPTPLVGVLGLLGDVTQHVDMGFQSDGDLVYVIGADTPWDDECGLSGSEYSHLMHGELSGTVAIDMELELRLQRAVRDLIAKGILRSAHDCSIGGAAIAVAKCAIKGGVGVKIDTPITGAPLAALFGESQSRVVVSIQPQHRSALLEFLAARNVPYCQIGVVGGQQITLGDVLTVSLSEADKLYSNGIANPF